MTYNCGAANQRALFGPTGFVGELRDEIANLVIKILKLDTRL